MNDHDELNDIQFQILDSLYFVEGLPNILEEVSAPEPVVRDEMKGLIDKGWIQVMEFDEEYGDYRRTAIYDLDHLENYGFLATKEGLLRHNGHQ